MLSLPSTVSRSRCLRSFATCNERSGSDTRISVNCASSVAGKNCFGPKFKLETSSFVDKTENFFCKGHKVRAAVSSDNYRAACISHSRSSIEIPSFQVAISKASGKSITRSKHVTNLHFKGWHFLSSVGRREDHSALSSALHNCRFWTKA